MLDYEDFIGQRRGQQWDKDHAECRAIRNVARNCSDWDELTDQQRSRLYQRWLENDDPFWRANALICLIHQAKYLLDRQIAVLERQFVEQGGYREQLAAERLKHRTATQHESPHEALPTCPVATAPHRPMVLRTAKSREAAGEMFLGCSGYPECKGTRKL